MIFPKVWSQGYFKTADEHHSIAILSRFTQYKRQFVPLQNQFLLHRGITGWCNINCINYNNSEVGFLVFSCKVFGDLLMKNAAEAGNVLFFQSPISSVCAGRYSSQPIKT